MRKAQLLTTIVLAFCLTVLAKTPSKSKIIVTGRLGRVMAIGAESTGWAIQLDSPATINGKQLDSIEVQSRKKKKLEALVDKHVEATGKITQRHGVETGDRSILVISSIKEVSASAQTSSISLEGSEWRLEDLAGTGVIDNVEATLTFPEAGKVGGRASCNRFFGTAEISGDALKFGALGSTRMSCPEALMNQEKEYLQALQAAERFDWKDHYLLIYCKGFEKPLRFTRMSQTAQ